MKNTIIFLLVMSAAIYSVLLAKPDMYFNKRVDYREFTVRSRAALTASEVGGTLESARERIAASELFKEGMKFDIYLPSSRGQFAFFTPLQKGDYVRVSALNGGIFIAAADFKAGEARKEPGDSKYRSLSSIITVGAAWEMTRRKLRPLTYMVMHEWKVRGYAAILAGLNGDFTPSDACAATGTPEQQDYRYRLMLETVLKEEQVFYNDLLDKNFSYQNADLRLKKAHCGR
ncbi:MAG: hypothetical protein CVU79_06680 [Elusimicrobia bacterium HGW-Elusimicrobia-3]|nr:MAG: hypothetical protein CVU79_06680 [Elusimicrobia bacterium HGW-Elusimicrobia-3]